MDDYPYAGTTKPCVRTLKGFIPFTVLGFYRIERDERSLEQAVAKFGPICVCIDARQLQFYKHGIVKQITSLIPNHAVLLVGYGGVGDDKYWIIKNSWGATWGENGYLRLARHVNACNITFNCVVPILKK